MRQEKQWRKKNKEEWKERKREWRKVCICVYVKGGRERKLTKTEPQCNSANTEFWTLIMLVGCGPSHSLLTAVLSSSAVMCYGQHVRRTSYGVKFTLEIHSERHHNANQPVSQETQFNTCHIILFFCTQESQNQKKPESHLWLVVLKNKQFLVVNHWSECFWISLILLKRLVIT